MSEQSVNSGISPEEMQQKQAEAKLDQYASGVVDRPETQESQATEEAVSEQMATLQDEVAAAKEQLLRAHAEMQNVRRRADNDIEKARKFALERFVRELLPVVDSLEKAVEAMSGADTSEQARVWREGVEMTLSLCLAVIGKFDVEPVDPVGQPFSPEFHEAMSLVPRADVSPNTVVAVLQKGYLLNGRLIRPAMVMVSRAP
jgi:molecular chaperone GrpE